MSLLRTLLLAVSVAMVLAGVGLVAVGPKGPGINLIVVGGVLLLGTLFERWRYRPPVPPADTHWERTGERFEDPRTGKIVDVLYDPRTGQRRYAGSDEGQDGHGQG